jgi:hypothetical protein
MAKPRKPPAAPAIAEVAAFNLASVDEALALAETFLTAAEHALRAFRSLARSRLGGEEIPRSALLEALARTNHQLAQVDEFRVVLANTKALRTGLAAAPAGAVQ